MEPALHVSLVTDRSILQIAKNRLIATATVIEDIAGYLPHLTDAQSAAVLHVVLLFAKSSASLSTEQEAKILRYMHELKTGAAEGTS